MSENIKTIIDGHEMEIPAHLMPSGALQADPAAVPWFADGSDVCAIVGGFKTVIADCLNHASVGRMDSTLQAAFIVKAANSYGEFLDGLELAFIALGRHGNNMKNGQERDAWIVLHHLLQGADRLPTRSF